MKDYVIIIVILIIILAGAVYTKNFLNKTSEKMLGELKTLKEEISKSEENTNNDKAKELATKICDEWCNINHTLSVIVVHSELDAIQIALARTKAKIFEGEIKDSLEELEVAQFLIKNVAEKEKFNLKNIF